MTASNTSGAHRQLWENILTTSGMDLKEDKENLSQRLNADWDKTPSDKIEECHSVVGKLRRSWRPHLVTLPTTQPQGADLESVNPTYRPLGDNYTAVVGQSRLAAEQGSSFTPTRRRPKQWRTLLERRSVNEKSGEKKRFGFIEKRREPYQTEESMVFDLQQQILGLMTEK